MERTVTTLFLSTVLFFTGIGAAAADKLPNFDIQAGVRGTVLQELPDAPAAAAPRAKSADGLRVRYDALTGNASRVSHPGGTVTGPSRLSSERVARGFLLGRTDLYHQKAGDAAYMYVPRQYSSNGLSENVWLGQQFRGIPVFKSETLFHVSGRGEILSVSGSPVPDLPATITATAPRISAAQALARAAAFAGLALRRGPAALHAPQGVRRAVTFDRGEDFSERPVVQLTYFPTAKGQTSLAWDTTLWQAHSTDVFHILVDAGSGQLLYRKNYTSHVTGQVYEQDSPQDGTPYAGVPAVLARVVKPFGGGDLFDGTPLFAPGDPHTDWWAGGASTTTVGNNTRTGSARTGVDDSISPASAPGGDFSFTLNLGQDPAAYQSAAIANLFYWNNRAHDVWYQFGFNEAAGNFQTSNFGLGGTGNDAVVAHAQYGADVPGPLFRDNANMSTPPDGSPGRMRMYVFDITNPFRDGDLESGVILHEYGHGVTNRLVGNGDGLVGFQGGAMGEGWSDFQALIILAQNTDDVNGRYPMGGYLLNDYAAGIRSQPYSVNPGVFTHTYSQISGYGGGGPEVHDAGEIMCNTLFQTYVRLVNRLGFSPGRRRMMQLFIDALKLSPDDPTFLDFRDALLQADLVRYGGADQDDIWACFASRGMGASASTSGPDDTNPQEAFDLPTPTFTISGHVTDGPAPVSGATMALSGPGTVVTTQTTSPSLSIPDNNPSGVTSSQVVSQTGTLTTLSVQVDITHTYIGDLVVKLMHPDGTQVVLHNRSGRGANLHRTYQITAFRGKPMNGTWRLLVSDEDVQDVGRLDSWTLKLGQNGTVTRSATTDGAGAYSFIRLDPGTYTVSGTAPSATLSPASRTVVINNANVTDADFSTRPTFTISGTVQQNGLGVSGVVVVAGGISAFTDGNGAYSIEGLPAGTYTVLAAKPGYTFNPASQTVTVGPSTTVNFSATALMYTISGTVTFNGAGLAGVAVTANGKSTSTDGSGNYSFTGLIAGNYVMAASKDGFTITTATPMVTLPPSATVNFNAAAATYSVSGTVKLNGAGVNGATISTGAQSTTSDGFGNYTLSGLTAGTYTLAATKDGLKISTSTPTVTVGPSATVDFTAVATYSVIGTVTYNGAGLSGVSVSVGARGTLTGPNGFYTLSGLSPGRYTVTATKTGYTITTPQADISVGPDGRVNFTATVATYSIRGTVTENGIGKSGVSVSAGGRTVTTANNGSYAITNLNAGSYTVTASLSGYTFTTNTPTVTLGPDATVDFAATSTTFSISGKVTRNGSGFPGVTVAAGGKFASTDNNGNYTIAGLAPGPYTVTATRTGYTITAPNPNVTLGPNATVNFTATVASYQISGTVRASGSGLADVSVSAGGLTVVTDGSGNYTIPNLGAGSYTVTATIDGYVCTTQTPNVTLGPDARVDFTATRLTYSISGTVRDGSTPVSGAAVSVGSQSALTGSNGVYVIEGLGAGTYTVTVSKSGVTFPNPSQTVTVGPNATAVNFTGTSLTSVVNFTLAANPVRGKKTVKGTFTLSKAVTANTTVSISSSNSAVAKVVKAAVVVKKGASSSAFSIKTAKITSPAVVTLSFTLNGMTYSRQITVQP